MVSTLLQRIRGLTPLGQAAALSLFALAAPALAQPPISATDPWVRAAPPRVPMNAGYMTLENTTRRPVSLTAVESPQFARIEMHRSFVEDGVSRMEAVEAIEVPARGSVSLEPGGLHLMLLRPHDPVRDGDRVTLTLTFDNGWTLDIEAPVRRDAPGHAHHH
jgi:periplasmic copper chaperone A